MKAYDTPTQSEDKQNLRLPVIQYDNCVQQLLLPRDSNLILQSYPRSTPTLSLCLSSLQKYSPPRQQYLTANRQQSLLSSSLATNEYSADVGGIEQSDNLEGQSIDAASPPEEEESYYLEEDNVILFGGFVGIESFCTLCQGAFPSKSLLNKNLKLCKILNLTCLALAFLTQLLVPVMESNALITGLGTELGFRD